MCGIVGFINADNHGKFGDTARLVFEQLLWHDTQRGADGTGVVSINGMPNALEPTIYKNAMWAPEFLGYHSYRNIVQKRLEYARAAIGHNRATTRGSVKNDNAHPFTHKQISLVHNGFIPQPDRFVPMNERHEVDSFAAAYMIGEKGEADALNELPFNGVLVWWNDQDKTLNMARNDHRELWCVPAKGHNAMFYASEWQMLYWIMSRNGLEPETKFKLLTPMIHFKFDVTKPKEWQRFPFVQPRSQPVNQATTPGAAQQGAGAATGSSTTDNTSGSKGDAATASNDDLVSPKRPDQFTDSELANTERNFLKLTTKEKRKYGIPETRHKLRKVCAKIHNCKLGSYFGQRFMVEPDSWAPYKNQRANGVIVGSKRTSPGIRIEIPNSPPEDYERLKQDKWMFATVVNAKKGKTGQWHLIGAFIPLGKYKNDPVELQEKEHESVVIRGPNGTMIELAKFQAMTQTGCGNCGGFVNPNNVKDMEWYGDEPICHICALDPMVRHELGFDTKAMVH